MYKDIKFWNKQMILVSAYQIISKTQFMHANADSLELQICKMKPRDICISHEFLLLR